MFKKLVCCLFVLGILIGQIVVFAAEETMSEATEWIKGQEGELTQGIKEEIVSKVNEQLGMVMVYAKTDMAGKTSLKNVNALVSEAVVRLDAKEAVDLMDAYAEVVLTYIKSGNMSSQDAQWATNEVLTIMGKKVKGIDEVNVSRTAHILSELVEVNGTLQGTYSIDLNQTLTLSELNQLLLNIEKAHRVTTSQLSSYSYKELARELPKELVLKSASEGAQVTLTAELVKKLVADSVKLVIQEKGFTYEVPVAFMDKHVGDFKVDIKAVPITTVATYGDAVNDGRVEVVVARDIKIGYATNTEMIDVSVSENMALGEAYVKAPYAVIVGNKDKWKKLVAVKDGMMSESSMDGTTTLALAKYFPSYTDLTGHWAEGRVTTLLARGIADRTNAQVYDLDGVMTRGEFVRMLINIVGTKGKSASTFVDVPAGSQYADIIESVIYYGFTIGVSGDEFKADTPLTREELVALVAKMHDVKYGYMLDSGFLKFKDMNDIAPYAKDAVSALKDAGYISGYDDNTFRPKHTVTRAEAISVLYKVLGEE